MQRRERYGFQLALLLDQVRRGVPVVNPPTHGQLVQLKPLQLSIAASVGLATPRTLITSDPVRAAAFLDQVGDAIYKPSMGGGPCCAVDAEARARLGEIAAAPVTFQERIRGTPLRLIMADARVLAAVTSPSDAVDHRTSAAFVAGKQRYQRHAPSSELLARCQALLQGCGLRFSAIDFMLRGDGTPIFLEANASPVYLDVEEAIGLPITEQLADFLLHLIAARRAGAIAPLPASLVPPAESSRPFEEAALAAPPAPAVRSFAAYAVPFDPDQLVGGPIPASDDDDQE
jgi:glutathione synthase/RimK-type ligase-like ATP-grasp enzyme